jgi:hypothetical protein
MSPSFWEFSPNHAQVIKFLEFSGLGVTESSTEKGEKEKENHVMFRRPKIQEAVSSNRTAPSSGSLQPPMGVFLPRQTPPPGWGLGSLYPYWTSMSDTCCADGQSETAPASRSPCWENSHARELQIYDDVSPYNMTIAPELWGKH